MSEFKRTAYFIYLQRPGSDSDNPIWDLWTPEEDVLGLSGKTEYCKIMHEFYDLRLRIVDHTGKVVFDTHDII